MKRPPATVIVPLVVVLPLAALLLGFWIGFRPSPAPLGLKSPAPSSRASPSAVPSGPISVEDAFAAACPAPAKRSAPGSTVWAVQDGGEVGYRVKEQYAGVTLPHEAVARTSRIRGWAALTGIGSAEVQLDRACFAADISSLRSIDTPPVPGMHVSGRDEALGQVINYQRYPVARLSLRSIVIGTASQLRAHLAVPGTLTIAGKSKAISFDTDIARNADAVSVAGKTIIDRNDFLQFDLSNAPVGIDTNVTLEFSIVLRQSAGA